jgi:N6-adenosine-specific RNA methylase IME4
MLWGDGNERMIINDLNDIKETYGLIYADPPWKQSKGGKKSVRENSSGKPLDYPTCSLDEIKEHLRLATESTTENSILFLWTIDKYLFEAQQIAESLGYKLHARMIWDKVTGIPAAFTVRYGHEYLLYMYKGKLTPVAKDERGKIHTVFRERVTKHSKKPDIAYEIIERLYPDLKKLEMYARETRDGWDSFGNEVA